MDVVLCAIPVTTGIHVIFSQIIMCVAWTPDVSGVVFF